MKERKKGVIVLDRLKLRNVHPALLARFYFKITGDLTGTADANSSHVDAFIKMLRGLRPNAGFHARDVWITREYDNIIFSNSARRTARCFSSRLIVPGVIEVSGIGAIFTASLLNAFPDFSVKDPATAYFDYDEILSKTEGEGLSVRPMRHGDRIVPLGMRGHKKIKEIFIEEKIPLTRRSAVPLLVSGDTVLWVAGIKHSDIYKVKKTTKRILKVEFTKAAF